MRNPSESLTERINVFVLCSEKSRIIFHRLPVFLLLTVTSFLLSCSGIKKEEGELLPEEAPKPFTVHYSPADGSVSQIDPPAFIWLPVNGANEYVLEYSRRSDFPKNRTISVACSRTIYVPHEVMGTGKWYWRFGVRDENTDEVKYSRSRAFSVIKDATPVPFPDVRQVIANLEGVRPRNFVRSEGLKRFRELGTGPLKEYVIELKKTCDKYIDQPLHPEPAFLSEDREQRKVDFVQVMRSTRAFNAGMIDCATAYLLTGDELYGNEARRRLLHLSTWDPDGSTNLFHNDEPGTEMVRLMPRTYDWIYPLLTDEDKIIVREVLARRIPQLYKILHDKPFEIRPYESHAMGYYINDLLESCLCMANEIPVEEMLEYVMLQLWSPFFPPYGGDEGGWSEGPAYWQWSTARFLRSFMLVEQNCGVDLTKKPWLQNTPYFKLYCNPPYAKMSPFGDSQTGRASTQGLMYKFGVTNNNPYAFWYDNQLNIKPSGIDRFIYYTDGDDKGTPPVDLPQARCFYDIGLACMHSDLAHGENNVQFLLRSSPFGSISHGFADQNSFVLFAYGEPLAIASGYYPYYASPHHSGWTWHTKSSNSLLVDGEGQKIRSWDSRGKIVNFKTTDYAHYALGDATEAYTGRLKHFFRHALFLRPVIEGDEPVVILFDDVEAAGQSVYDWLLHSLEEMRVDEANSMVDIRRGSAGLKVHFLTPQKLSFTQTDQFTVPPENENMPNQWHLNVRTAAPDSEAMFVTVLMPYRQGQENKLPVAKLISKEGWIVVELTGPSTRQLAVFRSNAEPGASLKIDNFRTKADVAAVAYDLKGKKRAEIHVKE